MYEWRQIEVGKIPTSSHGIDLLRSRSAWTGLIENDQPQRVRAGSCSGSDTTSTTAKTDCHTLA